MTTIAPAARQTYDLLMAACDGLPKSSHRVAGVHAHHVAAWYAMNRPGSRPSDADRSAYTSSRIAAGASEKTASNEWGVVRRYIKGGPTRSTAQRRAQSSVATVAQTAHTLREVASASPVRHLKLVESPKPLVKTEREALIDYLLDVHERIVEVRTAMGVNYLVAAPMAPGIYAGLAQRLVDSQLNAGKALRLLQPASAVDTPVALRPDEPQVHGVPVDPAFLAAHEGKPVSPLAIYAAVWSGIGLNGAVYDYRLKDARAALAVKDSGHMDAWRSRGQFLGALFMRHALVEDITDRVSRTWRVCELHRFLWACREHCCTGRQIDAVTRITQGEYAGQTVHDVLARLDMAMGLLEDVTPPDRYVLEELAGKPDALAHFERVRAQYAAFWETEK